MPGRADVLHPLARIPEPSLRNVHRAGTTATRED